MIIIINTILLLECRSVIIFCLEILQRLKKRCVNVIAWLESKSKIHELAECLGLSTPPTSHQVEGEKCPTIIEEKLSVYSSKVENDFFVTSDIPQCVWLVTNAAWNEWGPADDNCAHSIKVAELQNESISQRLFCLRRHRGDACVRSLLLVEFP